jgi:hypothetical protein
LDCACPELLELDLGQAVTKRLRRLENMHFADWERSSMQIASTFVDPRALQVSPSFVKFVKFVSPLSVSIGVHPWSKTKITRQRAARFLASRHAHRPHRGSTP